METLKSERWTRNVGEVNAPDNRRLDDVLAVLVHGLKDVRRFRLHLSLDGLVEVDTDFLRLEVYTEVNITAFAYRNNMNLLGFRSYWSVSSLIKILAFTSNAST